MLVSRANKVGTASHRTASLLLRGAFGRASFPWGKRTLLYLIICSPCSALLSMRKWLAWIQMHLISFTPLGKSHISFL